MGVALPELAERRAHAFGCREEPRVVLGVAVVRPGETIGRAFRQRRGRRFRRERRVRVVDAPRAVALVEVGAERDAGEHEDQAARDRPRQAPLAREEALSPRAHGLRPLLRRRCAWIRLWRRRRPAPPTAVRRRGPRRALLPARTRPARAARRLPAKAPTSRIAPTARIQSETSASGGKRQAGHESERFVVGAQRPVPQEVVADGEREHEDRRSAGHDQTLKRDGDGLQPRRTRGRAWTYDRGP